MSKGVPGPFCAWQGPVHCSKGCGRTARGLREPKPYQLHVDKFLNTEELKGLGTLCEDVAVCGAEVGEECRVLQTQEHEKIATSIPVKEMLLKAVLELLEGLRSKT